MIQTFSKAKREYLNKVATRLNLSKAEKIVFKEILTCKKQEEIAKTLYIAVKTVKFHTGNILKKAKAKKSPELFWELDLSWPTEVIEKEKIEMNEQ